MDDESERKRKMISLYVLCTRYARNLCGREKCVKTEKMTFQTP